MAYELDSSDKKLLAALDSFNELLSFQADTSVLYDFAFSVIGVFLSVVCLLFKYKIRLILG